MASLKFLNQLKEKGTIYNSVLLFNEQAIKDVHINASLPDNGDLLRAFLNNIKSAVKWESERVHSNDDQYNWRKEYVTGTSVAELAERKLQNNKLAGILLNFSKSSYSSEDQINIKKNSNVNIDVDCSFDEKTLTLWLRKYNFVPQHDAYDPSSKLAPLDDQTILAEDMFEKTQYKNKGRRVYRLKGTNQLWVVDASEGHQFGEPHLEVFSEINGEHLGTSLYNKIDLDKRYKRNRKINLQRTYLID